MVLAKVAPGSAVGGDRDDATVLDIVRERAEAGHGVHPRSDPGAALGSSGRRRALAIGDALEGSAVRPRLASGVEPEAPGKRGTDRDRAVQPSR